MSTILTTEQKSELLSKIKSNADSMITLAKAINAAAYCIMHEDANFRSITESDKDIIACPSLHKSDIVSLLDIMGGMGEEIFNAAAELDRQLIPG